MEITNIKNIAANNGVPWSTLAEAIDNNFTTLVDGKADITAYDNQFINLDDRVDTLTDDMIAYQSEFDIKLEAYKDSVPTSISQLTNDAGMQQCEEYTYAQLVLLADANSLIPGSKYILTDYECIYKLSNTVYNYPAEGWQIVLTASSSNDFEQHVTITYPTDSVYATKGGNRIIDCKYRLQCRVGETPFGWESIDPENHSKGIIYYMEDSNHNICNYDFKHIKFKRIRVTNITPNTTIDNKLLNQYGVYRTYLNEDNLNDISDQRAWLGAGAESEKQLLNNIFDGNFRNVEWGLTAYSDNFVKKFIKPYADTTDASKSYLGYWNNTDVKPAWFRYDNNNNNIYKVIYTESDESKMFYTFDFNGEDYSINSNCHHNHLHNTNSTISNTVFLIFNDTTVLSYNVLKRCNGNTILLIPEVGKSNTGISECNCDQFHHNVIIASYMFNVICKQFTYNLCLRFDASVITSSAGIYYSILIGGFNSVDFKQCSHNLLFGDPRTVQLAGSDSYVSPADGNYWYDDVADHWFGYNIMAPFQYGHFFPHTNTNTVVLPYNKGVIFNGTIQHNYFTRLRWGVKLEYGSCLGCMFSGDIVGTTIAPSAFTGQSHGLKVIETNPIPSLQGVDVQLYLANRHNTTYTTADKTLLADRNNRCIWVKAGSTNKIIKYSDL